MFRCVSSGSGLPEASLAGSGTSSRTGYKMSANEVSCPMQTGFSSTMISSESDEALPSSVKSIMLVSAFTVVEVEAEAEDEGAPFFG